MYPAHLSSPQCFGCLWQLNFGSLLHSYWATSACHTTNILPSAFSDVLPVLHSRAFLLSSVARILSGYPVSAVCMQAAVHWLLAKTC